MELAEGFRNSDNWDDADGYFRTRPGELIISRYLVNRRVPPPQQKKMLKV